MIENNALQSNMDKEIDKLPKTAYALYVKMYCKRKENKISSKKNKYYNNMIEATKSWLCLSENEKLQFLDKYKKFQTQYKKMFADYLKSAEPYMKAKVSKRTNITTNNQETNIEENMPLEFDSQGCNNLITTTPGNNTASLYDTSHIQGEPVLAMGNEHHIDEEYFKCPLPKPTPPYIKTAQELFELVKTNIDKNETWISLPQAEKKRYRYAVLSLKKDYIKRYRAYLESLDTKELLDYYNKTI